jgi:hypothetical protein
MRKLLIPDTTRVTPAAVNRYLLPNEQLVLLLRQHPLMLAPVAATATGALTAAIAVSVVHSGPAAAKDIVWLLAVFLILRCVTVCFGWFVNYIVVTKDRFIMMSGVLTRTIAASDVTDLKIMTMERSTAGRVWGYGTYRIGPDGPDQLVVDYIPYPEQTQLELANKLFN